MDPTDQSPEEVYSVWALPPEPVRDRFRRIMEGLRAAYGGPAFEPHVTVVGDFRGRRSEAVKVLRAAAASVQPYTARVTGVARGSFFYQWWELAITAAPTSVTIEKLHTCRMSASYMETLQMRRRRRQGRRQRSWTRISMY
uniref:Cyclic phosphodiesterase n=1 Tax=Zea mays TaxID=4577 RepID=A0A804Q2E7_MAIZE